MFTHLHVHSPYSFLDGASELETLVRRAASLGMEALALTDHDNVCAAVKFTLLCRAYGLKPILGAEMTMEDDTHLTLLAQDQGGYANLCHLLTVAHAAGGRLNPHLPWDALESHTDWLFCLSGCRKGRIPTLVRTRQRAAAHDAAIRLRDSFGPDRFFVELQEDLTPYADLLSRELASLARSVGVGVAATNNVHYAERTGYTAHDVLRCIAARTTVEHAHPARPFNDERYLKSAQEMMERFVWCPEALAAAERIARQCEDALPVNEDITPAYPVPAHFLNNATTKTRRHGEENTDWTDVTDERGSSSRYEENEHRWGPIDLHPVHSGSLILRDPPHPSDPRSFAVSPCLRVPASPCFRGESGGSGESAAYLRHLVMKGAQARYRGLPPAVVMRLEHELAVICQLGYADYFLMVWEIVRWARKQGIRATGRGSAADSCVAYCLCLTDVDVISRNLPFARFLAPGRAPDIDTDFPADRRDDVFRYIVRKYGEGRVGMVCVFHTFWAKSAVRDVGKALGIPEEALKPLSERLHSFVRANQIEQAFDRYAELKPYAGLKDRFKLLFDLCGRIAGFPRHIGTHSSGIVISRVPLTTIAPLQPSARGITQIWTLDKDDAEAIGAIKFDVLSLRALAAVADAETDLARTDPAFRYDRIPMDDAATYRMFRAGAAVGTFQFESAAQMALAATLHPRHFEDLVASVALIRPGPIRGNVVSRFVACRNGWMRADYAHPCLEPTLAKTYGCIVYQEQVNEVVSAMTGWSDTQANNFRKSLKRHGKMDTMDEARADFVRASCERHPEIDPEAASRLFEQIEGWGGYGFVEGHAASFALTGFKTGYLSVHHPAEYFAGLMNHQPMGFFNSNTLAGEARRRGVRILPVEINRSLDKCYAEEPEAIRLGLRLVAELREEDIASIVTSREEGGPYRSLVDFSARVPMHRDRLENLILAGAFDLLHEHRRGLLWKLDETLSLARTYREAPHNAATEARRRGERNTDRADSTDEAEPRSSSLAASPRPSTLEPAFEFDSAAALGTPVAWEVDDLSPWEKFLWTWRLTGVCADCHVFAWLRPVLDRWRVMTAYQAQQQPRGTRVTVAGLNVRPHRPPTRSGEPILFTLIEDETELLQATVAGAAIDPCTPVFVTSPAVLVRGVVERRGTGMSLRVERAKPLSMQELMARQPEERADATSAGAWQPMERELSAIHVGRR